MLLSALFVVFFFKWDPPNHNRLTHCTTNTAAECFIPVLRTGVIVCSSLEMVCTQHNQGNCWDSKSIFPTNVSLNILVHIYIYIYIYIHKVFQEE
jgi:hypothetical protein